MRLRWSDQAQFDLDWMYEGVFAACRDFDTTDMGHGDGSPVPLQLIPGRAPTAGIRTLSPVAQRNSCTQMTK